MDIYNFSQVEDTEEYRGQMIKAFGKNIRNIRLSKNLTQEQLAEMSSINDKYLGEIERGEKNPTAIIVYKLSRSLGISVCELFLIEDCSCRTENRFKEVERLFEGKNKKDIHKAIRILEVFFE